MTLAPVLPAIARYVQARQGEVQTRSAERCAILDRIASYVSARHAVAAPARLVFICTHNSRRSQLAQVWAATAAAVHGVPGVETYSGGTEATAFDPRAIEALRRAGFRIVPAAGDNPRVRVTWSEAGAPWMCFSKCVDDPANPAEDFAALMTCAEADRACPSVRGAAARIAIPYDDPKVADGTPEQAARYDERTRQIATEMLHVFARVRDAARQS
jgi:hypothetical protein